MGLHGSLVQWFILSLKKLRFAYGFNVAAKAIKLLHKKTASN